jgi:hypothetical protein
MEPLRSTRLEALSSEPNEAMNNDNSVVEQGRMAVGNVPGHYRRTMPEYTMTQQSAVEFPNMVHEQMSSSMSANIPQLPAPTWPHAVPMPLNSPYAYINAELSQFPAADVQQTRVIAQTQTPCTAFAHSNIWAPFPAAGPHHAGAVPHLTGSSDSHAEVGVHLVGVHLDGYTSVQPGHPDRHEPTHPYYESFRARWDQMLDLIYRIDNEIGLFMSNVDLNRLMPFSNFYSAYVMACVQCGPLHVDWADTLLRGKLHTHETFLSEVNEVIAFDASVTPSHVCYELRVYHTTQRGGMLAALDELESRRIGREVPSVEPAVQNAIHIEVSPERRSYDRSGGNMWFGAGNRGVAIVNPDTGCPIEIPNQPTEPITNNGNVRNGRNSPLIDATSRSASHQRVDGPCGWSDDDIMSWISSVDTVKDDRVTHTVPRNFGRNIQNHESVLHPHTDNDQGRPTVGPASTNGSVKAPACRSNDTPGM